MTVSLHRDEDKVRFESVDTGIGITKDDLSTLFHKFVRGSHVIQMPAPHRPAPGGRYGATLCAHQRRAG